MEDKNRKADSLFGAVMVRETIKEFKKDFKIHLTSSKMIDELNLERDKMDDEQAEEIKEIIDITIEAENIVIKKLEEAIKEINDYLLVKTNNDLETIEETKKRYEKVNAKIALAKMTNVIQKDFEKFLKKEKEKQNA